VARAPAPGSRDRDPDGPAPARLARPDGVDRGHLPGQPAALPFHPSVITSLDVGKLAVGATVPIAYDPNDPKSADLAESWRLYAGPVIATLLYAAVLYYAFLA
jgi:hypothetical protein